MHLKQQRPQALNKGDSVGIFLPSSPVKEPYRSNGKAQLAAMGYIPVEVPDVCRRAENADFLARDSQQTAAEFAAFYNDSHIKALWAGRGGYGANLMLPFLENFRPREIKPVIGSSDVSYLLWYLADRFNMMVHYGPMVYSSLAERRFDQESLRAALEGRFQDIRIQGDVLIAGKGKGIVTGGCLTNLVSLLGTPYFPIIKDRILLLEDIGERPYRLDRMFWQLTQAGVFAQVRGLLLGRFPKCFKDEKEKHDFQTRVSEYLKTYHIPVITDLPLGHSDSIHTLPLGAEVAIDTLGAGGLLTLE